MTEHGFDLPPKAPPDVIAQRNALGEEACRTLAQAGIPVYRGGHEDGSEENAGATVHVDPFVTGGVLVEWHTDTELTTAAVNFLACGVDPSDLPYAIRHYETMRACRTLFWESLLRLNSRLRRQTGTPTGLRFS